MSGAVIITGASRGIGRAAAEMFAGHGYGVVINYLHSGARAYELCEKLKKGGSRAIVCKADITRRGQVEAMVERCMDAFGSIDVLVNNAGIAGQKLFTDITEHEWDHMMDVHVKGMFHCCQCVLPYMIKKKSGRIINISSIWGIAGASCEVHYSTAKAAIIGFTKALAKELGPSNITVNCVAPGLTETDMISSMTEKEKRDFTELSPVSRAGAPEEIASAIFFLASGGAGFITGQVLSPNGGIVM